MADLSDKKSDLEDYEKLEASLRDNEDLIGLVELSDEDEIQTLEEVDNNLCLLYTSPSPRDISGSRMPSSA